MTDCKLERKRPRSLHNVISDIELLISNDYNDKKVIKTDIVQAIAQLRSIHECVDNGEMVKAYSILNPSAKYFKDEL
jgi:hypothetical protein